ncbi:hypothetical protein C0993_008885 [Termitomyces sp. T159_Od127]|nr:hypothetical protein C0993_008885 [Termitomyces sp. T159_Od127]
MTVVTRVQQQGLGTFLTYYCEFQKIFHWLLQHSKIHTNKERRLFQQGISTSLWAKIARHLEILKPTHHLEDSYDVKDVYEASNWHLKSTDMSLGISRTKGILLVTTQPQIANNAVTTNSYIKKEDMEAAISAAIASTITCIETMINTQLSTPCTPNATHSLCHFCGKLGHTMSRGQCNTLEQYIRLGQVKRSTDSKVVLSTGTSIPNYLELKSYQERVDKWHWRNSSNIATSTLSGNTNPDTDQHVQQQLIHKILHLDSVDEKGGLSKKSCIAALEMELNALKNQMFDEVEIPRPKQPLKGYKSMVTVANNPAPPAPEPSSAPPSTVPANNTPTIANTPDPLLLLHSYSELNNYYQSQHNKTLVPPTSELMALTNPQPQSSTLKNLTRFLHIL